MAENSLDLQATVLGGSHLIYSALDIVQEFVEMCLVVLRTLSEEESQRFKGVWGRRDREN